MIRVSFSRLLLPASLLAAALSGPLLSAAEGEPVRLSAAASNTARAQQLAADVRELATGPGLSRAKREKHIATAVRTAVVAASAYRRDPAQVLGAVSELAAAAAQAAPAYAEVIANAAALAPGVARIDGASGAIRAAAQQGAQGGGRLGQRPAKPGLLAGATPRVAPRHRSDPARAEASTSDSAPAYAAAPDTSADERSFPHQRGRGEPVSDQRVVISLTTDLAVRRDDNIYLSSTAKVADTTISAVPGLSLRWGQNARSGGSLSFSEAFNRYQNDTSPNVSLARAALNTGWQGPASAAVLGASYQQFYQSSADVQATGRSQRIRSNLAGANASFEGNALAKIGYRVGANYAETNYRTGGLIGNRQTGLPVDVLFHVTPKTDLSVGYAYGTQKPDGGGDHSKDHYFNVGARGDFTAKLSGGLTVGYQSRRVGQNPSDHLVAFTGSFNYELTPKTALTLALNRNFNASSLGATTKNTSVRLGLDADLTPQWRVSASTAYQDNQYGPTVFRNDANTVLERTDRVWETDLSTSYLFTDWLSTSLSYYLRSNHSTLTGLDFTSNAVSLSLGLRY